MSLDIKPRMCDVVSEESLNIEKEGDPDAWNSEPNKGGKEAAAEAKIMKKLEKHTEFVKNLMEKPNRGLFDCLINGWVVPAKIQALIRKQEKEKRLKKLKKKQEREAAMEGLPIMPM